MILPRTTVVDGPAAALRGATRRVALHMLPPLAFGYLLVLLDRTAVALHAGGIGAALGLSPVQVGLVNPILFLAVLLFGVPSALMAGRVGAQRWLVAMLVVWGGASVATGLATGPWTFYAARAVAGIAQAGFLPTALFMLAGFTPASRRTGLFAWMVLTALLASVLAPLLAAELQQLAATRGVGAWRWMLGGLGALCLPLAAVVALRLPDRPEDAAWLRPADKDALAWSRAVEPRDARRPSALGALIDPRLGLMAAINFALALSAFAASTWFSALMHDGRAPVRGIEVVFVVAVVGVALFWSRKVDRTGHVGQGLVVAMGLATVAYAAAVFRGPVVTKLVGLVAHAATLSAAHAMVWSMASRVALRGGGGAAALAVIDVTGMVGAFIAPRVVGGLAQQAGSMQGGLLNIILVLLGATGLAALLRTLSRQA